MLLRRTFVQVAVMAALLGTAGCRESTAPMGLFVGEWALVSFSDHGTVAEAIGTMLFRSDGTFSTDGLLNYPGDFQEVLEVDGSYVETREGMVITIGTQSGTWVIARTGTVVTLKLKGPEPSIAIVMRR